MKSIVRDLLYAGGVLALIAIGVGLLFGRPMLVTGEAVDQNGQLISGLFVRNKSKSYSGGDKQRAYEHHSDSFVSACLLCPALQLRISAEGFETESVTLSADQELTHGDRVEVITNLLGVYQRIRVTLYPSQKFKISRLSSGLTFAAGKPQLVAALHPKHPGGANLSTLHRTIRKLTHGKETVAAYIALAAKTDENQEIMMVSRPHLYAESGAPASSTSTRTVPAHLRLSVHNSSGGFILFEPPEGLPRLNRFRETFRRMRRAPAEGYLSSIALDLEKAHLRESLYFFYCLIDGRYGKGHLTVPRVENSPEGSQLVSTIEIWFNDSGNQALALSY